MRRQTPAERCGARAATSRAQFFLHSAPVGAPDEHVAKTACAERLMVKSESTPRGGPRDGLRPKLLEVATPCLSSAAQFSLSAAQFSREKCQN